MNPARLRIGLGCAFLPLAASLVLFVGCAWIGPQALDKEIARVRAQCTPGNLLEIYRTDLFRLRSAQTREFPSPASPSAEDVWRLKSERARVISTIPFTAETMIHRTVLMNGSQEVASLKFIGISTPRLPFIEKTPIFDCVEVNREFYLDKFEHEFGVRDGRL